MKKVILLFSLILSIFFVSCGSSSNDTKSQLSASIFTQDEVNYVREALKDQNVGAVNGSVTLVNKVITDTEIYLLFNGTATDDSGTPVGTYSVKQEILKNNSVYIEKITFTMGDTSRTQIYRIDLSIPRLFDDYLDVDYFTQTQEEEFFTYIRNNLNTAPDLPIFPYSYYSSKVDEIISFSVDAMDSNANTLAALYILHSNSKYILVDKDGILLSCDNLNDIYTSGIIINKIIEAQGVAPRNISNINKKLNIDLSKFNKFFIKK